jgi:hypothetical protein
MENQCTCKLQLKDDKFTKIFTCDNCHEKECKRLDKFIACFEIAKECLKTIAEFKAKKEKINNSHKHCERSLLFDYHKGHQYHDELFKPKETLGKEFYQSKTEMADCHLFDIATEKLKGRVFVSVELYSTKEKKTIIAKEHGGYVYQFEFDTYFYAEKLYKEILNRIR